MFTRLRTLIPALLVPTAAVILAAAANAGTQGPPSVSTDLIVHEWGTFTSVAGPDGRAVEWTPLSGPSDLPCFVTILNPTSIKFGPKGYLPGVKATVRMETPVVYFYTPRDQTVSVRVRFPQGLVTEWYPNAIVPNVPPNTPLSKMNGGVGWTNVNIRPFSPAYYPLDGSKSHYYAARETDAASVQVGLQHEKFLFYRGLGSFQVPVMARVTPDGTVAVESTDEPGLFVLFEKRHGRLGYRLIPSPARQFTVARPALTGSFEALRQDLRQALTGAGLYAREADAMIETWRDSWFEDGTRLFYVMSQASVDAILPLEIEPRPSQVARVFVGRMEIITPEMLTDVEQGIRQNNLAALKSYGRFLEPIARGIEPRFVSAGDQAAFKAALQAVEAQTVAPPRSSATLTTTAARD